MAVQLVASGDALGNWLAAAAALERLGRALGDAATAASAALQPAADALGAALKLDASDTVMFAEEVSHWWTCSTSQHQQWQGLWTSQPASACVARPFRAVLLSRPAWNLFVAGLRNH